MSAARPRTRGAAVLAALLVLVVLTGCVPGFLVPRPPSLTSTPVPEPVESALRPFYTQQLVWSACDDGLLCATARSPLDWADPDAGEIELALVRHPATRDRIGSLLVNPGGPGGSGYEFVADMLDFAVGDRLQQRFDIVGFDPRGVGRSSAIACLDPPEMDDYLYGIPDAPRGSDAWIAEARASAAAFGAACAERSGALLEHVDTVSAARDLDLLRAVLGDAKLNYLGFSYGTFLGATYAGLYPDRVGRLVLDGALDPAVSEAEVTTAQARGFEGALRAYLEDCLGGRDCPFPESGGVDGALAEVQSLLASVEASPLRGSDGRRLGASTLALAIIYPLYSRDTWSYLGGMFASVQRGEADLALAFADAYNRRDPDGGYADNSTEAFMAVNCADYPRGDTDPDVMRAQAATLAADAPVFGPYLGFGAIGCADWPAPATGLREPIHAEGADPIVVIGTTGDPATPYQWAVSLAQQLDSGVLVSSDSEGHTAYNRGNRCVDDAVERYLVDGAVPTDGLSC